MSRAFTVPDEYHNPRIILKDDSQSVLDAFLWGVQKAIADELDKRGVKEGSLAQIGVEAIDMKPGMGWTRVVFTVRHKNADETDIEFRGTL